MYYFNVDVSSYYYVFSILDFKTKLQFKKISLNSLTQEMIQFLAKESQTSGTTVPLTISPNTKQWAIISKTIFF